MKVIIIGAGEVGKALSNMLASEKKEIVLVESEESLAEEVAEKTDAVVIHGDATQMDVLKQAGIEEADAVIAVTNDDKTNLMVCEIAKSLEVPTIISRVNKSENEQLFAKLQIQGVVPVVGITVTEIKRMLESTGPRIIAQLGKGEAEVFELAVGEESKLIGKPAVIKEAVVGAIYRNGEFVIPGSKTTINKGDVLIVVAKSAAISQIQKTVSGKG